MNEILAAFAVWIADGGYKYDGVSIWKKEQMLGPYHGSTKKELYYSTEQVVQEFLKSQKH